MKTVVPQDLKGKELFKFLAENKSALMATKKAAIKTTDPVCAPASILTAAGGATKAAGADGATPDMTKGEIDVKVVANTAWWCDSHMDVLTDTCYDKSISERGALIPHIADHIHRSDAHVGDVKSVYKQPLSLKELGLDYPGSTTALVFESTVKEIYNPRVFLFYGNGKIKQHSIGLLYVSLGLCINDKDYLPEFELWKKYYDKVINKDKIDERGYFWIVPEIKVMENSCVLFGANELTPTLEVTTPNTTETPSDEDTSGESSEKGLTADTLFTFN